eukprot:TRINITY_DN5304_c0_g2_i1.p1 TRINITY_DN5304_c0_g2~~TRINITY_DN5304_c0_g2_i1.p1  ORF type:complete len:728 (+),score=197.13 TRINITY_DN5304_c0_g2_i1:186-2186(+)
MSTYLLAMVVGEYDHLDSDQNGVKFRVYTPKGKSLQGEFALNFAKKSLLFFEDMFKIKYPLPKLDLISIPDFEATAMENWGAITFRETALLVDSNNTALSTKQLVAIVISHEIGHMGFGDLVIMAWVPDLWLNEGFASWAQYASVAHVFPEWDIWTQFVFRDMKLGLELDALKNSHPVFVPIEKVVDIAGIFDVISYSKGVSIIRMIQNYLGTEKFIDGIKIYLNRFSYKNTFSEDLWLALTEASNQPVSTIMKMWVNNVGFPIISVSLNEKDCTLSLSQERFFSNGVDTDRDSIWKIPVNIATKAEIPRIKKFLFTEKKETIKLSKDVCADPHNWININPDKFGFYRVKYDSNLQKRFLAPIKNSVFSPIDRLSIQQDLFSMCRAGFSKCSDYLLLLGSYNSESNFNVWSDINSNLKQISLFVSHLQSASVPVKLNLWIQNLFQNIYQKLGWDKQPSESEESLSLRAIVLSNLGLNGNKQVIKEATKRFDQGYEKIDPNLRSVVYKIVLANNDETYHEKLIQIYRTTQMSEEKVRILDSLGFTNSLNLLKKTIVFMESDEVRPQDRVFALRSVDDNPLGREISWEFLKQNWDNYSKNYNFMLGRFVDAVVPKFAQRPKIDEMIKFFESHEGYKRAVDQAIESALSLERWIKRDGQEIKSFFEAYN